MAGLVFDKLDMISRRHAQDFLSNSSHLPTEAQEPLEMLR